MRISDWSSDVCSSDLDDGSIGDIVVTAQRREQRLQDVPITISAITSAQAAAAGVTGTSSLQFAVPGLIINRQANNAAPYIRGIRSEERRVGKGWCDSCSSRWSPKHSKKKKRIV